MNIRLARMQDLSDINELFDAVIDDLRNIKKINMWTTEYPYSEFKQNIQDQELYIIEKDNMLIGSFVISSLDDPDYHSINWTENKRMLYLSRLVILPSEQGKGYSKQAVEYIINDAIKNGFEIIRLMVHIDNFYAIKLYEKYGFVRVADCEATFDDRIFWGYEKELI